MKRRQVFAFEIWGAVCEWPVEVDLSRDEATGTWTLYFRYVDPEARHSENVVACDASEIHAALEEHNASVLDFAKSIETAAAQLVVPVQSKNLNTLAAALRQLPLAETDGR